LRDIRALPGWMAEFRSNAALFDLFPASGR